MNLLDYIKGRRKGTDANQLEKESMKDPFMYEAMEGFDSINDDHIKRIENIQSRISKKKTKSSKKYMMIWQGVAATAVVIFALGGYLLLDNEHTPNLHAQDIRSQTIDIYIPEKYYEENIVTIAKHNTEAIKAYKPNIGSFKVGKAEYPTKEELESLSEKKDDNPIDIYIPQ